MDNRSAETRRDNLKDAQEGETFEESPQAYAEMEGRRILEENKLKMVQINIFCFITALAL
jgi:hypothetical protein